MVIEWARSAPALFWLAGGVLAALFLAPLYRATRRARKDTGWFSTWEGAKEGSLAGEASTGQSGRSSRQQGRFRAGSKGAESHDKGETLKRNLRDRFGERLDRKYRRQAEPDGQQGGGGRARRSLYEEGSRQEEAKAWRPADAHTDEPRFPDDTAWAHRVLGTSPESSPRAVKKAYLELMKSHHPDRAANGGGQGETEASEKAKRINMAYDILKNRA